MLQCNKLDNKRGMMKNLVNYSLYECPFSDVEKDCGHELKGPEGYEDIYGVWCACGFRGPVFCLEPEQLGLELKEKKMRQHELSELHYFEILDRSFCALEFFDDNINSHPCVSANPELQKAADKVIDVMYSFYNLSAHFFDTKERATHYLEESTDEED